MTPFLLPFLLGAAQPTPVLAPISQVTVFTDQARVVRTASVTVAGTTLIEFPPLRDTIDVSSVRVESTGAEVKRVDIERIAPEQLRTEPAKKLLARRSETDPRLNRARLPGTARSAFLEGCWRWTR
jgi:hypothetical protein